MRSTWTAFALAAAVSAVPATGRGEEPEKGAAAAPGDADPGLVGQDIDHPPPGSAKDVALWRAGMQVTIDVPVERARASRLQIVLLNLRYADRLKALAARGGEDAERAEVLSKRIDAAIRVQAGVQTARWPVDTYRVCGYPAMQFGSMLASGDNKPEDLAKNRAMLFGCVDGAQAALKMQKESNDRLEAALKDAEAALEAAGLGARTVAQTAAAQTAAAQTAAARAAEKPAQEKGAASASGKKPDEKPEPVAR